MPEKGQIHLLRHAQATHNTIPRNQNIHDPPLTPLGLAESARLKDTFSRQDKIGVVLTSPLRRAIQTSLSGFGHLLATNGAQKNGLEGSEGVEFRVCKNLQPGRDLACDTGSTSSLLIEEFPTLDFDMLEDGWAEKGILRGDKAHSQKAEEVLRDLAGLVRGLEERGGERTDIVCVTHGINYEFLDREGSSRDWGRAEWKSFVLEGSEEGGWKLVRV